MKNQDTWDEANRYGANMMLAASIVTLIVSILCYYFSPDKTGLRLTVISFLVMVVVAIASTQSHLKKTFDENGKRK